MAQQLCVAVVDLTDHHHLSLQTTSTAQRPAAKFTETYHCPFGPDDRREEVLLKQSQAPSEGSRVRTETIKWGCKAHFVVRYLVDAYTSKHGTEVCGVYYNLTEHGEHPTSVDSLVGTLVLNKLCVRRFVSPRPVANVCLTLQYSLQQQLP
jgi:hypothetical protein